MGKKTWMPKPGRTKLEEELMDMSRKYPTQVFRATGGNYYIEIKDGELIDEG